MKELVCDSNQTKRISHVTFGMFSAEEMRQASHVEVVNQDLYSPPARTPTPYGPLDSRMGTSDKSALCGTCGVKMKECVGHFGHIELALPVFHFGFFKQTLQILRKVCKTCARVLLPEDELPKFTKFFYGKQLEAIRRKDVNKMVSTRTEKVRICPHCGAYNGKVVKAGPLKLYHVKYLKLVPGSDADLEFVTARKAVRELTGLLDASPPKVQEDMTPLVVRDLFMRIPDADCHVLDLAPGLRPESLLMTTVMAPPIPIRPSVPSVDGSLASNEDDISMLMHSITRFSFDLARMIEDGHHSEQIMSMWDHLQLKTAQVVNGDLIGNNQQSKQQSKPLRGISQRLKGKQGRFRGNLSGKRVDFSARTVISPDPNLGIDQVAVPRDVCKTMTYPEKVTHWNMERLKMHVRNGPSVHPGANVLILYDPDPMKNPDQLHKVMLQYGNREKAAENLKIGDTVERHLIDGDVVLFNRQPSLHKMSIMAHLVKVRPWRTFRFNECVCNPYNADFDGDEMNLHVPQTEEARAEAITLMGTKANICTPRNGEPLIASIQDFITGSFLLTQKDQMYTRAQAACLAATLTSGDTRVVLPTPAICKPRQLWTGKQIFTLLLTTMPGYDNLRLNCSKKTCASYIKDASLGQKEDMCPNDGWLVIFNSYHVSGSLDKGSVGDGSKDSVYYALLKDYDQDAAAIAMLRMSKLTCEVLKTRGFSLGIGDVTPGPKLVEGKVDLMATGYEVCDSYIKQKENGTLHVEPGMDMTGTLEIHMVKILSDIRQDAGTMCKKDLPRWNAPVTMARCKSKGSDNNLSQMIASVGQQTIGGKRIPQGFFERTLPHFTRGAAEPAARGFVANSFYTGLEPTEFFMHMMCGREGLVDTAVKTAETGYMSRRLMKALEDLSTDYDLSVRNSSRTMIQFRYGDDGLDPVGMEGDGTSDGSNAPVNLEHLWTFVNRETDGRKDRALLPYQILAEAELIFESEVYREVRNLHKSSNVVMSMTTEEAKPQLMTFKGMPPGHYAKDAVVQQKQPKVPLQHYFEGKVENGTVQHDVTIAEGEVGDVEVLINVEHFFITSLRNFLTAKCAHLASVRRGYGLDPCLDVESAKGVDELTGEAWAQRCTNQDTYVSVARLTTFLSVAARKYARATVEPGTAVGAVGAQSIGEPGTQMTLKTFHFAGIASMNVTQGVPRIKEIINASKAISSPLMTAPLENETSKGDAISTKGRVAKTLLGSLLLYIDEVYNSTEAHLVLKIDLKWIRRAKLDVTIFMIADALLAQTSLKLKPDMLEIRGRSKLVVRPSTAKNTLFFALQLLRQAIPNIMVTGKKGIERGIVTTEEGKDGVTTYKLMIEGTDMRAVMGTRGVRGCEVTSNHICEVEKALGIEAARATIIHEIQYTMSSHGMTIDSRHVMLLADLMSFKGEVLGITRFGIAKMKDSVFMLASFEKTADHLFDAALHGTKDSINGVSECIIFGIPMQVGTGLFKQVLAPSKVTAVQARKPIFDDPELHRPLKIKPKAAATTPTPTAMEIKEEIKEDPG